MKNAVEKRENALKTARETLFNKINQAYSERKAALLNAWAIQNNMERQKKFKKLGIILEKAKYQLGWNIEKHIIKSGKHLFKIEKIANPNKQTKIPTLI
jgi:ribosomal protein S4